MAKAIEKFQGSVRYYMYRAAVFWFTMALKFGRADYFLEKRLGDVNSKGVTYIQALIEEMEEKRFARAMAPDLFKVLDHVLHEHAKTLKNWDKVLRYLNLAREILKGRAGEGISAAPALGKPKKEDD